MKAIASLLPLAAAVAPPRIELDLSAMTSAAVVGPNTGTGTHPDGTAVNTRHDWTETCAAGTSTHTSCPFPNAAAYDHHDQKVAVTTRVRLIDNDGTASD